MRKKQPKYWYEIWVGECPVCGRDQGYRERIYGRKPKRYSLRYRQVPNPYCGCMDNEY